LEYAPIIAAILFVDLVALISPGPNFILITSSAVSKSRSHAVSTAFGIATGSFVWAAAAALGIASVLEALPILALALKIIGSAYLIYLGIKLLRSRGLEVPSGPNRPAETGAKGFWRGFLVNMTNPKSAAYYASVFAAFLTPDIPVWVLIVLIGAIASMSLAWHVLLAIGFSATRVKTRYVALSKSIDRFCGAVLVLLGLRLAWDSQ
jgi:RhtB (resistance to homoserine/threonine) family protein